MLAALAPWPGCGRRAIRSSAKARSVPSSASTDIAALTSATRKSRSRSLMASARMPSMPSVPLISARPSLAVSVNGSIPLAASASAVARRSLRRANTSPSPIRASPQCASGARSPLAPSEPCSGTTGVSPAFSMTRIASATSGRVPE